MIKLTVNPDNPRTIDKKDFEKLKKSVQSFTKMLEVRPIAYDENKVIWGGNMRYAALEALVNEGLVEAKDEYFKELKDYTLEEKKEFAIRDNVEFGKHDWDVLMGNETWADAPLDEWGLDPTEWTTKEVIEDDAPEVSDEPAVSKLGEIYQLGKHRIMCGDPTKIEDVEGLMDGNKADMVFTDPPYGVSYASKNEFLNNQDKGNRIQTDIKNDTMSLADTEQFIYDCFVNLRMILAEKSSYYITAPQGGDLLMMMMMMMQKAQMPLRHMIIWVKNNHVLGRTDYNYKHEPILYGWVNTHNFYGKGSHRFSTWEVDKPHKSDLHPTMKPIELVANALLNSTLEDELVADIFLGSGSTLIACEQTNRICYGMELDEKYLDVVRKRWAKYVYPDRWEDEWQTLTPSIDKL